MSVRVPVLTLVGILLAAPASRAARAPAVSNLIVGGERDYTVVAGDSIWGITGRFTMTRTLFEALNALPDPDRLRPGMHLRVSDRHIVPAHQPDGIVIDLAARTLYWFTDGVLRSSFPVGIGRAGWGTPTGRYRIVGRREDPIWHVPPSIQGEMRAHGEPVTAVVGPGPDNPLGKYWIQLSAPGYGLHGTNAPASIGKYATHGCLRLLPEHVEQLYHEAPDGTRVEVVYAPVKLARDGAGHVHLEVHSDVYRGQRPQLRDVHAALEAAGLAPVVDWARVDETTTRAWGVPEDVTAATDPGSAVPAAGRSEPSP
jgi:L,D-transpeptidase ErfK/SrfK